MICKTIIKNHSNPIDCIKDFLSQYFVTSIQTDDEIAVRIFDEESLRCLINLNFKMKRTCVLLANLEGEMANAFL